MRSRSEIATVNVTNANDARRRNKVIATMVIMSLDDRTYCARSAFSHLGLW